MPIQLQCQVCGKIFFIRPSLIGRAKYCSRICKDKAQSISKRKEWVPIKCQVCDKIFYVIPYRQNTAKTCSRVCSDHLRSISDSTRMRMVLVNKKHWSDPEYRKRQTNALLEASRKSKERAAQLRRLLTCKICGKTYSQKPCLADKSKYCSKKCAIIGNSHGLTKGRVIIRELWKISEYREKRLKAYKQGYGGRVIFKEDLGHHVRSSWETNYCRILRYLGIKYEYEVDSFSLGDTSYIPDIKINDKLYVEVKGYLRPKSAEKIKLFRKLYPLVSLVIIDKIRYKTLERVYSKRIPLWEYKRRSKIPTLPVPLNS